MQRLDDYPIDPDIAAALDAIDATLAGEAVDPEHAEIAELALLLTAERPQIDAGFSRSLDEQMQRRFAGAPRSGRRWLRIAPLPAIASAAAAAIVAVVVLSSSGSQGPTVALKSPVPAPGNTATSAAPSTTGTRGEAPAPSTRGAAPSPTGPGAGPTFGSPSSGVGAPLSGNPHPPSNGRKIIQSAQLALTATPDHVDDVAQEVFDVVGAENGIVNRSTVTATGGTDGYAEFQLSIPSSNLSDTMSRLSRLRNAHVASRTDSTQDVNNQYVAATRQLADARALRTSLLKQLASATTQQQIDSLNARIRDAEASITTDEAALRSLTRQINLSDVSVTINAAAAPVSPSSGFTIGKGSHDAVRVLAVAAGVTLIALAALVPAALLCALAWWIATMLRRRRREHALDLA